MPAQLSLYSSFKENVFADTVELGTDDVYLMLLSSSYSPNMNTHTVLADVSASEIAVAGGYAAGGWNLAKMSVSRSGATVTVDLADLVHTATGAGVPAWRYGVLYANVTRNTKVKPLIALLLGNDAPADIPSTPAGTNLVVQWNASGVYQS
jgi:hypothetical protein